MSNNKPQLPKFELPSELKRTLQDLEGTLSDWENITPELKAESAQDKERATLEKDLKKKARDILYKLKSQIDDLS